MVAGDDMVERWLLWRDVERRPGLNMAVDETLLELSAQHESPVLRFYGWDRPCVSIGYMQAYAGTRVPGFSLVRRPTGGGVVFHDHDFTYSVVIPRSHRICELGRMQSYGVVNGAVANGLRRLGFDVRTAEDMIGGGVDRATMVCFREPTRYDILLGDRKVSGSAQRRTPAGILHQGSIYFDRALPVSRECLANALMAGFVEKLSVEFAMFADSTEVVAAAEQLAVERYDRDDWSRRR